MMIKFSHRQRRFVSAVVALVLVAGFAGSAGASRASAAPGNGFVGACNMLADATMGTTMANHTADQGDAGMWRAAAVSGCL